MPEKRIPAGYVVGGKQKHDWIGVALGAMDGFTETKLKIHIFVADKGDDYEIADGLPHIQQ